MTTDWTITPNRPLIAALVAVCVLLWPAIATADAPPGTYTFAGHTFHTDDARLVEPVTGGTAYIFDNGKTFNWSSHWNKFTSMNRDQRWWTYRGRTTRDRVALDGCTYIQHRSGGEWEIDPGYRWNCRAGSNIARYVMRYRRAPKGMRCWKRGYHFRCTRATARFGRQTASFTYRPGFVARIRSEFLEGTIECGAVSTANGASGKPGRYVVFARNWYSCHRAFSNTEHLENVAAYTAHAGAPGGDNRTIGVNMHCSKIAGHDSTMACTNGSQCVVMGRFSRGQYARVQDEWAWSVIAMARVDPFDSC